MTKKPQTIDNAREALEALVLQREELETRLQAAKEAIGEADAQVQDLSYELETGEADGDAKALAQAEDRAASARKQVWRLKASIQGTIRREEIARAVVTEQERQAAQVELDILMAEVSGLGRSIEPRLDEFCDAVRKLCEAEEEALALARQHRIVIHSKAPRRHTIDLVRDRIARLKTHLPALLPILDVPGQGAGAKAAEALKGSWKVNDK